MNHIFLYPFICVGTSVLFPTFDYHKRGCYEHRGTSALWHGVASFGYILKSGIAGYSDRSISNFLRNLQIDFQSVCTSLQSHQQWRSVPLSPNLHQHVLSPEVFILAILIDVRFSPGSFWFVCFSLITKDFKHFLGASQPFEIPLLWILC